MTDTNQTQETNTQPQQQEQVDVTTSAINFGLTSLTHRIETVNALRGRGFSEYNIAAIIGVPPLQLVFDEIVLQTFTQALNEKQQEEAASPSEPSISAAG